MCAQCAFKYVQNLPGSQWVCVSRRSEDLDLLQMHQKKADCRTDIWQKNFSGKSGRLVVNQQTLSGQGYIWR